jgi:two-component system response regulator DesR
MIKTLVADSRSITRTALTMLLRTAPGIEVVGDVGLADEIVPSVLACQANVVVIDADSLGQRGFDAVAQLSVKALGCRSLILSSAASPGHLTRIATVGASGFLLKDASPAQFVKTIREISAGYQVIDCRFTMVQEGAARQLTAREADILRLVADGADVIDIAGHLCLAIGTVRNNLSKIVIKLNARTRVDAVRIGRELGLI